MPTEEMEEMEQVEQVHRLERAAERGLRPRNPLRSIRRLRLRLRSDDAGAATAEYLVATMAAVGFAGLLIVILRGNEVRGILTELVRNALSVG